jgi:hypothetical protein
MTCTLPSCRMKLHYSSCAFRCLMLFTCRLVNALSTTYSPVRCQLVRLLTFLAWPLIATKPRQNRTVISKIDMKAVVAAAPAAAGAPPLPGGDSSVCWICLEGDNLTKPCKCACMRAHKQCLAAWQLAKAGTRSVAVSSAAAPAYRSIVVPEAQAEQHRHMPLELLPLLSMFR